MERISREKKTMAVLTLLFALMMSVPFLVPHCGWVALFGLVPLLCMERIASLSGIRRVWAWHYSAFVIWNAITTFWVCNATVGGGIFAVLANSLQMSVVFGLFRLSKKVFKGTIPYIFLAVAWMAWERYYLGAAQISWPWLVLGNSFARTISLAQFYEFTGTMGGSLWIWASNLSIFGLMCALSDGSFFVWNNKAKSTAIAGTMVIIFAPIVWSRTIWNRYNEEENPLEVAIMQPNIDPYHKFGGMTQDQQNALLESQVRTAMAGKDSSEVLILAPETFTSDIVVNDVTESKTWRRFRNMMADYPKASMIFGASASEFIFSDRKPSVTARFAGEGAWRESRNSAIILNGKGETDIFHKSKLVVAVEMTPYPAFFCKIDDLLGGVMGRCIGQDEISLLNMTAGDRHIPVGCAVCYESIYGEYCTGYVRKGAQVMTVITNDAWWGDTPGYRQHLSYSSLRAIELRRDIARCGNTGISAIINQKGEIISKSNWWEQEILQGKLNMNDKLTFFAKEGDIIGRISTLLFALLALAMVARLYANGNCRRRRGDIKNA